MQSLLPPPLSWELAPFVPLFPVLTAAIVATIPRYMRRLGGFDQPAVVDASVWPFMRFATAALTLPVLERVLATLAPEAYAVVHDALAGRPPLRDEVVSAAEARRRLAQGRSNPRCPHRAPAQPRASRHEAITGQPARDITRTWPSSTLTAGPRGGVVGGCARTTKKAAPVCE